MINMKSVKLVLFFGVLGVGMLAGFSIGYDHGVMDASSRAHAAALKFYDNFKVNTEKGRVFSLWDYEVIPIPGKAVKICASGK
ncbi:MAG: hypothetical protein M0Z58_10245 [Nitrospiraceae bacterium]|nr:hypothetical protein [Nitrospiraceae bacterium]